MIVFAHRGYSSKAPENTMAAFELALAAGAGGLELDVHLSKDGQVVVIHDQAIDRTTTGSGLIGDYTLDELIQFDAGSWFDPEFKAERLPTLAQVCRLIQDKDILLNVELKMGLGFEELNTATAVLLDYYELWERTIVSSFNHYALAHFKQIRPQVRTGILYNCALVNPWVYAQSIGATALHAYHLTIIPEIVAEAQQNGLIVNTWTVDEAADIERVKQAKVDGIITNDPGRVLGLL